MSTLTMLVQVAKQWLSQHFFYVKNKIEKPKEVLVIVAKSRPRQPEKFRMRY